jgi:hypothetical protein
VNHRPMRGHLPSREEMIGFLHALTALESAGQTERATTHLDADGEAAGVIEYVQYRLSGRSDRDSRASVFASIRAFLDER